MPFLRRPIKRNPLPAMAGHRRILSEHDCHELHECDEYVSPPLPPLLPPSPSTPFQLPPVGEPYDGHHHLLVLLFIVVSVVSAVLLLSIAYFAVLRRRRRRGAYFFHSSASDRSPPSDFGDAAPPAFDEAEAPLHHVWYIRTVGLDEADIEKIAVTQYKATEGARDGDGDCSICLGEFDDGDLVRLLPKCGHAFHVPCIDTWLRARVNCPLCRAPVVDPEGAAAGVAAPPLPETGGIPVDSGSSTSSDPDVTPLAQSPATEEEQRRTEGRELVIDVATDADPDEEASEGMSESSLDSLGHRRRSASMDSTFLDAIVVRLQPEGNVGCSEEAKVRRSCGRQGNMAKDSVLRSLSTGGRAFFLYGHSRVARSAAPPPLPL